MLINSVILFLRDALPVFILLGILWSFRLSYGRHIIGAFAFGILLSLFTYWNISWLSEQFEGAGYELLTCVFLAITYMLCSTFYIAFETLQSHTKRWLLMLSWVCVLIPNGSSFVVYFAGYWSMDNYGVSLPIGTILGLGICTSVAVLAFLGLSLVNHNRIQLLVLLIFVCGQAAQIIALLQQIDWISGDARVWDTSNIISDESEYGHLLSALVGYEATPTAYYLGVYLVLLLCPLLIQSYRSKKPTSLTIEVNS